MALLTLAVLFCVYTVAESTGYKEEIKVAAPSLIRLCHDAKYKPFFCLICNGFDFSCFSTSSTTQRPTESTTPPSTTTTMNAITTTVAAATEMASEK